MTTPTRYDPSTLYDFTDFQSSNPTTPLPADKIEIQLNAIQTTTDEIIDNLGFIQRNDGALANNSVGNDQLKSEVTIGVNPATDWVTGTEYEANDTVYEDNKVYRCLIAHTAGVFATDLAALKWTEILDFDQFITAIESDLTAVEADLSAVEADLAATEADVASIVADLAATEADVASIVADLAATEADLATIEADLATIEGAIGTTIQAWDANLDDIAALTVARGDLLIGNSTPEWSNLAKGSANYLLKSDGTDISWGFEVLDEDDMSSDSATKLATQRSIKAYADNAVGFRVYLSANQTTTNNSVTVVAWDSKEYDIGGNFNTSTYRFVAPIPGKYLFCVNLTYNDLDDGKSGIIIFRKNGSNTKNQVRVFSSDVNQDVGLTMSAIIDLSASDYVDVTSTQFNNTDIDILSSMSSFSCHLLLKS